jgi:hypothetical protein
VERCRSRARSRDAFAMIRPLGVLSPSAPKALACADALGYRGLDPRPRPSSRLALFTRSADWRFSGSDCRPTTSATYVRHTVTLPSIRFSRFGAPRFRVRPNLRSFSPCLFKAWRPSPLEEGPRALRTATALPKPARRRCKHAAKRDLENHPPTGTPLAGDASIRPPLAAMAVGRQRWTVRAESP